MTNLITEARELCEAATPGPWECRNGTDDGGTPYNEVVAKCPCCGLIASCHPVAGDNDAAFIARSRTLIPELCDALEKAQEQNKQLLHEVCKLACESVERDKALARLEAEVEGWAKAEQEGRLLVLPCKVGDTVYAIADCADILKDCDDDYYTGTGAITCPFEKDCEFEECDDANRRIFETYVGSIYKDKDEPVNIFLDKIVDRQFYPSDFGKTVFLTRAEAEAALKGE